MLDDFLSPFRSGARSLRTVLALYFVPISVIPALFISVYATRVFVDNTKESLVFRASSERDAIVGEIDHLEAELFSQARSHATLARLLTAMKQKNPAQISEVTASFRSGLQIRVYSPDGKYLGGRKIPEIANEIAYISKDGLRRVRAKGETLDRYFGTDGKGFVTIIRVLLHDAHSVYGILEEECYFGSREMAEIKNRRSVDVVFMNRDFTAVAASFALSEPVVKSFSSFVFQSTTNNPKQPIYLTLGDSRFAGFLYDFPAPFEKNKRWGYFAVFLSMTAADATVGKLKLAMVYLTALLILISILSVFVLSNRLVRPIEVLVSAMKRMKTGRVEHIPHIDSTYEIEYLVRSFNEMARNINAAKSALELKLEELGLANSEIKNTQVHLVQSAKMISLGQIVAGVAHELNNPIGFIYSNMHHLSEYVERLKKWVDQTRTVLSALPEVDRKRLEKLDKELEIDFLLRDIDELTKSCVDGAKRTKDIVMGLRTFSRADESALEPSDLHEGLRNTIRLLSTEFKDKVTIHEEFGKLPLIECNISQLNQVFMNLLSNSAQAITTRGNVWIRTRLQGNYVIVEIEDNGSGIPPDALEKIFDPFFTTKKVGQGTGLGLSIAYGLIQKHRGTITVDSQVGKGTKFTIMLPVKQSVALTA